MLAQTATPLSLLAPTRLRFPWTCGKTSLRAAEQQRASVMKTRCASVRGSVIVFCFGGEGFLFFGVIWFCRDGACMTPVQSASRDWNSSRSSFLILLPVRFSSHLTIHVVPLTCPAESSRIESSESLKRFALCRYAPGGDDDLAHCGYENFRTSLAPKGRLQK